MGQPTLLLAALVASGCAPSLHPLARAVSAWDARDVPSLARFVAAREPDPVRRIKALHDWVADNIRYDVAALELPELPADDADADWVLAHRRALCAGYANLLAALGRAAGLDIISVRGKLRRGEHGYGRLADNTHAWDVVALGDDWYAIDPTWDAGDVRDDRFHKRYTARYFLLSPDDLHDLSHDSLLQLSLARIGSQLEQLWQSRRPRAERLALVDAIRAEAAPADDPELGAAGDEARAIIDQWLRAHATDGDRH